MGSSWQYALVLSGVSSAETLKNTVYDADTLETAMNLSTGGASFNSLSLFSPYDTSNSDYYSDANNAARASYCRQQCNNDADCLYYCSNLQYQDTSDKIDISLGNKQASNGWYPQTKCGQWKKNGSWWMGSGSYEGGCYAWDYKCLSACMGSSWEYAPMMLAETRDKAFKQQECFNLCPEGDKECANACKEVHQVCDQFVARWTEAINYIKQELADNQVFVGASKVPLADFNICLNSCFPKVWPDVSKCYEPCQSKL